MLKLLKLSMYVVSSLKYLFLKSHREAFKNTVFST